MRLLFVCTGNICRSPVAERLTMARASQALADSPELTRIEVVSAGTRAEPGAAMAPHSARALEQLGGTAAGFRARRLTAELAESADLVLTLAREHRTAVLGLAPRGLRRTFTLAEAAEPVAVADLSGLALVPMEQRARELGLRLDAARSRRQSGSADDVADPMGHRAAVHADVASRIHRAIGPLADVLFTSVRDRLSAPLPV
ncbi:low molecular weight phosphatase family protein [Blastococcus sp. TF02A-26]|uniref:arsenate reductase/protein-tyrosine-phosphatase family protein n=1 Tax=Blastococcus sp. TF02A-26 TaxID=2250577 RepID=UPI001313F565|nr:low molecular weight phosphatase family protein [Blastococcus sp. TF02A-26]